jgi:hypothetical protein
MDADARSRRCGGQQSPRNDPLPDPLPAMNQQLNQLEGDVVAVDARVRQVSRALGQHYSRSIDDLDRAAAEMAAALGQVRVSVAEARRRRQRTGSEQQQQQQQQVQAQNSEGGAARGRGVAKVAATEATDCASVLSEPAGGERPEPEMLERAAGAMVVDWLRRKGGAGGLEGAGGGHRGRDPVRLASRALQAFREASYPPHEWLATLESMRTDELQEFLAALEQSPATDELLPPVEATTGVRQPQAVARTRRTRESFAAARTAAGGGGGRSRAVRSGGGALHPPAQRERGGAPPLHGRRQRPTSMSQQPRPALAARGAAPTQGRRRAHATRAR